MSYVKLHRKFLKWEWYNDINTKTLFIHLLLKANWKDSKFEGEIIKRGSLVTGRKNLAKELGISEQSIRTSLSKLKSTNEIATKSTNKFTIITVVNYDKYQNINELLTNETTSNLTFQQPTTNQQLTTIEEEYKNIKNINIFNNTYTLYDFVEKNFGRTLSPVEYETLLEWEQTYGKDKTILAFREGILNDVRNFKYTQAILDAWKNLTVEEIKNKNSEPKEKKEIPDYNWLEEE